MCGIIGATSTKPIDKETINLLFLLADERGGDACGFTNGKVIEKKTGKASEFLSSVSLPEKVLDWVGHTRSKTYGVNNIENAHPFSFEHVTGVHNGTIDNFFALKHELGVKYDVDSELVYHMIDEIGLEATLPKLKGALALAYWDKRDSTNGQAINLYRFERPLSIGFRDGACFFASLPEYLKAIGCSDIEDLPENVLYVVNAGAVIEKKHLKVSPVRKEVAQSTFPQQQKALPPKTKEVLTTGEDYQEGVPWFANVGIQDVTGIFVYWWFEQELENQVCVKLETSDFVTVYDMSDAGQLNKLLAMYECVYEDIVNAYTRTKVSKEIIKLFSDIK
jgi:asparagine synthetase B (glutamine-hydrolysing)